MYKIKGFLGYFSETTFEYFAVSQKFGLFQWFRTVPCAKISYYGNGTVPEADKLVFPDPKPMEGYTAMWRNVETGELYLGKDIPEFTAATYEAYYEAIP